MAALKLIGSFAPAALDVFEQIIVELDKLTTFRLLQAQRDFAPQILQFFSIGPMARLQQTQGIADNSLSGPVSAGRYLRLDNGGQVGR